MVFVMVPQEELQGCRRGTFQPVFPLVA
jgi:hypothetical protein